MFDPLSWGLGFVLTKVSSALLDKAFARDLPAKLIKEVEAWSRELPDDYSVVPTALFPDLCQSTGDRLALEALRHALESDQVPSEKQWQAAFVEQWEAIRSGGGDLQPFFTISEEDARKQLADLAKRIRQQCSQDERLFRGTVLAILEEIAESRRQDKTGEITISPINRPGHNCLSMKLGEKYFHIWLDFHVKSNLRAKIVSIDVEYGSNYPAEQRIKVDERQVRLDDYTTPVEPIILEPYNSKRIELIRCFWPSLPPNFDPEDSEGCEMIRDDLDYGEVTIKLGVDFEGIQTITPIQHIFKLEAGGKLVPIPVTSGSS